MWWIVATLALGRPECKKALVTKNTFFLYSMLPYKFCWTNKPNGEPFFGQGHSIVRYSKCPPCPFIVKGHFLKLRQSLNWKMLLGLQKYICKSKFLCLFWFWRNLPSQYFFLETRPLVEHLDLNFKNTYLLSRVFKLALSLPEERSF